MMKTITIYTTPTCGYCRQAKAFFREHDVAYTEKDVATDHAAAHEMVEKSGQWGVPVIVVTDDAGEETVVVGFDRGALVAALGLTETARLA